MKSAYEIAMERLEKAQPMPKVTEEQKKRLAEIDTLYQAKMAERETFLQSQIIQAKNQGNLPEAQELQEQLHRDFKSLRFQWEEAKEKIRHST